MRRFAISRAIASAVPNAKGSARESPPRSVQFRALSTRAYSRTAMGERAAREVGVSRLARELMVGNGMTAVVPLSPRPASPPAETPARAAYALARAIAARPPLDELLRAAVAASRELFDADEAALLLDEDRHARVGAPVSASLPPGSRPRARGAARVVYCAPLALAGESLGIIRLTNPGAGRALSDADLLLLNRIAADLAAALGSGRESRRADANVFVREGDFWNVAHAGAFSRVKDGKGMRQIALLLASPGREHHALDLAAGGARVPRGARAASDPLLDAESRRAYRARIASLRAESESARASHDLARAERAETELECLVAELRRCLGLGGRARSAASPAERARQNVTRSIRAAIRHLATHQPALARHFERTIRTGLFCAYEPDPRVPSAWEL